MEYIKYIIKNKMNFRNIDAFLRQIITPWMDDSRWNCRGKCIITRETNDTVLHHVHAYHKIKREVFVNLNLPEHQYIDRYSDDELLKIGVEITRLHHFYGTGVVMKKSLHKEFHSAFGIEAGAKELGIYIIVKREGYSLEKGKISDTIQMVEMFHDTDYKRWI